MFGRTFGLDGRESYRELRLELLCCPTSKPRNCSAWTRVFMEEAPLLSRKIG
jgi:hypothetical protein